MADREEETVGELTEEQRRQVEEYLEEEEGGFNRYKGWLAIFFGRPRGRDIVLSNPV